METLNNLCYVIRKKDWLEFLDASSQSQWTPDFFKCTKYDEEEDAREDAEVFGGKVFAVNLQLVPVARKSFRSKREGKIKETLYGHNAEYDDPAEKYYNQHDDTHEKPSHTKNKDLQLALSSVFDIEDSGIVALAKDIFDENDAGHYDWHDVDDLADAVLEAGYEDEANALWDAIADDRQLTENRKLKERIADKALPYYHEFCRRLFYKLPDFIDSICESHYVTIEPEDSSSGCIDITISTGEDPRDAVYVYVSKSDVFIEYPKTNFERQVVYTPEASFQEIEDEVAEIVNEALNELEKKIK